MNKKELKKQISQLPTGGITTKRIKNKTTGNIYEYKVYQWRESGKQKSRYLADDEAKTLSALIEERKILEVKLAEEENTEDSNQEGYLTNVVIGQALKRIITSSKDLKKREIINALESYVFGDEYNRVFILYGLRRTGKTTMIKQVISEMSEEQFEKTAFIQISPTNNLGQLNKDLKKLMSDGYLYVFLDEVTLMDDFIEGSALLSDVYAASGMKIVLSGTDSLVFWISKSNELYDRCNLLHTTLIPYREFENVLDIKGIDEYIEYGGTMSIGGNYYNAFATKSNTDEYVDSSIARNIQHSLRCYQDGDHFRHLYSLYEHNELTSAINRVVEHINHCFTVRVLTQEFTSGDLSLSARNLRKENNVLDLIDRTAVTERLKQILEIKNLPEQTVKIDSTHVTEIEEYLAALDLYKTVNIVDIEHYGQHEERTAFTQVGLRYSQAKSLIKVLLDDPAFAMLSFDDRKYVSGRILHEIKGRLLEDIVLVETAAANPNKEVFKLQFANGEYDMVVFDNNEGCCSVFEIKYSEAIDSQQYRHLIDEKKLKKTEFRYGKIEGRYVLYRGQSKEVNGIQYLNVEDYLNGLHKRAKAQKNSQN